MTRIQRARALRLGYILASLLCASVASARPQDVPGAGFDPELDRCWESAWERQPEGGAGFERELSTCLGMPFEPSRGLVARCEAKAELDYRLAVVVGVEPDAAYEDSYAACVGAP